MKDHRGTSRQAIPGDNAIPALELLIQSFRFADDSRMDVWEFALEIDALYGSGITISDLRWLLAKNYIEHGRDVSKYEDSHRRFEKSEGFNFMDDTCMVLTETGGSFVSEYLKSTGSTTMADTADTAEIDTSGIPVWDSGRRELYFFDRLVKRFRVPARNQEWILDVFEEDGWPTCIDDPLPQNGRINPKTRLHDAINRLNQKQVNPVLRFRGNGHGNGVLWEGM